MRQWSETGITASFMRWVNGCYSCQRDNDSPPPTTKSLKIEAFFFGILIFVFAIAVIWIYCIAILENESNEVNWFLFGQFHTWINWFVFFIFLSVLISLYPILLCLAGLCSVLQKPMHVCHKVFVSIALFIVIVGLIVICGVFPGLSSYLLIPISNSLEVTAFFLQIFGLIIWTAFAFYVKFWQHRIESPLVKKCIYAAYWSFFIFLLIIPSWSSSPCVGSSAFTNPKPLLIGHRGAPILAPENTVLSFEKAIRDCDVSILETDVRISSDGVPFLLHDYDLIRTTNVEEVFPSRQNDRPETFTWNELQQLNAGEWFLNQNPFLTNGALSEADRAVIRQQKIPKLADYAELAAKHNRSILFDLFRPPGGHNFIGSYIDKTLEVILNSSLPQENVIWLRSGGVDIEWLRQYAPNFRIASHDPPNEDEIALNIQTFNLIFTSVLDYNLRSYNYSVIAYTINNNWAFTRAWCQGVWAVTTNQCLRFKNTNHPSWRLTQSQYLAIVIIIDILCVIAAIAIYVLPLPKQSLKTLPIELKKPNDDNSHVTHEFSSPI